MGRAAQPYEPGAYDDRASFIEAEEGPDGNIYLLSRCLQNSCTGRSEPAMLKLDPSGRLLKSWGVGLFDFPHGLDIADEPADDELPEVMQQRGCERLGGDRDRAVRG